MEEKNIDLENRSKNKLRKRKRREAKEEKEIERLPNLKLEKIQTSTVKRISDRLAGVKSR